jgi:DNA-binding Lrp family transcriptional regulator
MIVIGDSYNMAELEEIEDVGAIAGQFDIIIKLRVANTHEFDEFVFNYLRKFPEVIQTQTLIVMRGWK